MARAYLVSLFYFYFVLIVPLRGVFIYQLLVSALISFRGYVGDDYRCVDWCSWVSVICSEIYFLTIVATIVFTTKSYEMTRFWFSEHQSLSNVPKKVW